MKANSAALHNKICKTVGSIPFMPTHTVIGSRRFTAVHCFRIRILQLDELNWLVRLNDTWQMVQPNHIQSLACVSLTSTRLAHKTGPRNFGNIPSGVPGYCANCSRTSFNLLSSHSSQLSELWQLWNTGQIFFSSGCFLGLWSNVSIRGRTFKNI